MNTKISNERMQEFCEVCNKEIYPIILGKDGKGVERLRNIVEQKRIAVKKRKQKRMNEQY